ncbi:amino acid adenylation domain protein [Paenibacillus curdlanolyticus YK9]|uniref:Amino acid adenylation domain protein n=1 Tax=Paenibacillus curdlanolyticus YK9 TaxID=717606 RepID=E0IG86_9BACL|nr:amino acid adenylation domain-containing protein [Paenibacillus curdlanolyticus]EFM08488.1 amino acid adenylation domain protein [Paenibacillus curdlanolyticus YK9]
MLAVDALSHFAGNQTQTFWSAYMQDFDVKSILPLDHPSNTGRGTASAVHIFGLGEELEAAYRRFMSESSPSLEAFHYAVWAIVLQKYNNSDAAVFGTPSTEGALLPFRTRSDAAQSFSSFLAGISNNVNERRHFEDMTLGDIARSSELDHTQPLFDSAVYVQRQHNRTGTTEPALLLEVVSEAPLELSIRYQASQFEQATILRIASHITRTIEQVVSCSEISLKNIDILSAEERHQVINGFNELTVEYDRSMTIDQLFEATVERMQDQVAVICGDRELTYRELNAKANRLARVLQRQGVGPEKLVGLIVERDIELIVGMLGVMKAGGAYLPVDPAFPLERINYMFRNGNVNLLLTSSELSIRLDYECDYLNLDELDLSGEDDSNLQKEHDPKNLMYVLYTSGSTGQPKGVAVEHRNVAGYVHAFCNEFQMTTSDRMVQQSTVSFDISVEEIYPILLTGGTLLIAKRHEVANIPLLVDMMFDRGATMISGFPLLLNDLNKYPVPPSLHTLISGGDVLREEYVTNLIQKANVYNTYGPSETTVCINYFKYKGECSTSIPTGRTIANYKVYILDRHRNPMPIGLPGEVCIGGVGVSREYLNRPDITNERYIPDPYNKEEKMFTCGDLARWMPDGNVEFLGRMDDQIKIRGRRTEPGEVQRILMKHATVNEAHVIANTDKYKHKYLTAYVTGSELLSAADLKAHLAQYLPEFMVPPYFVQLDKLPLTPSGKVDKKALPHVID